MADKFPSDKQDKFMLRLPAGMRDKIAQEAKSNSRSMNAEIVTRLEGTFPKEIELELLESRKSELLKVDWQIEYVQDELYKQRRHFSRVTVDVLSNEYQEHLEKMTNTQARLTQLQRLRAAIAHDIEHMTAPAVQPPSAHKKPRTKRG